METMSVILSGVTVFILGELFLRFFLAPLHKLKELKGEIASILLFYANNYGQQYQKLAPILEDEETDERIVNERIEGAKKWNDELSKAADKTRTAAAKLIAVAEGIPFYKALAILKIVPPKDSILKAKSNLIGLSNSFAPDKFDKSARRSELIAQQLNIEFIDE